MLVPRLCFMDQDKLSDLADADLVRKGNADPRTWVFGKLLWKTQEEVVFFRVYKRPVLEMPSQVPKISSPHDELRDGHSVEVLVMFPLVLVRLVLRRGRVLLSM